MQQAHTYRIVCSRGHVARLDETPVAHGGKLFRYIGCPSTRSNQVHGCHESERTTVGDYVRTHVFRCGACGEQLTERMIVPD